MILLRAFNDDRLDALQVQQVRKHQACGARANDANLCPYHGQSSRVIVLMPVVIDAWPYRLIFCALGVTMRVFSRSPRPCGLQKTSILLL